MADVFLSYSKRDRPTARLVQRALEASGLTVWSDRDIAGGADWRHLLEVELERARSAVVLWSAHSVASHFVISESEWAQSSGKLIGARIGEVTLPLPFRELPTIELGDWSGAVADPRFESLLQAVRGQQTGHAFSGERRDAEDEPQPADPPVLSFVDPLDPQTSEALDEAGPFDALAEHAELEEVARLAPPVAAAPTRRRSARGLVRIGVAVALGLLLVLALLAAMQAGFAG